MSNAVVYKVSYVDPDCDETSEGGRHYTGDCLRLEVYERHDGERGGYGSPVQCVERIDFDLHDGGDGIMEMLEYLTDWDADVQAERLGLVHPCGHCGMAEGAGAAGLCAECNAAADEDEVDAEGSPYCDGCGISNGFHADNCWLVCPVCGEVMEDDHYTCEAFAALLDPTTFGGGR